MPNAYYSDDLVTLYHGDCLEVMQALPAASVDLVLTDPPYYRVKNEPWDKAWNTADAFLAWIDALCVEWRRILKPNGSLYCFASPDMAGRVEVAIRKHFNVLNTVRWEKGAGWHKKADKTVLRSYLSPWEAIVLAEQRSTMSVAIRTLREAAGLTRADVDIACSPSGKPTGLCYRWEDGNCIPDADRFIRLARRCGDTRSFVELERAYLALLRPFAVTERGAWSDLWDFAPVPPYPGKHVCEKPLPLLEHIIQTSTRPNAVVFDGFCGSGSTGEAAVRLGRSAILSDMSEHWVASATQRISNARSQPDLLDGAA